MSSGKPSRPSRTVYMVKRAETTIRAGLEACLQPLSITPAQYVTLSLLSEQGEQSSADLARKAGITPQSISETVATLVRKELITRSEHPDHRRILTTRLTDKGIELLKHCNTSVDAFESAVLADIPADELATLRSALRKIATYSPGKA